MAPLALATTIIVHAIPFTEHPELDVDDVVRWMRDYRAELIDG